MGDDKPEKPIRNNHYWKHKKCWNEKLEMKEPSVINIELGGSRPNSYQYSDAYKKYGPFNKEESRDKVIVHACDTPEFPYSEYKDAVNIYNNKKLGDHVQNTYFKRNPALFDQNSTTYDKQSVAHERIRLKEEQKMTISKYVNIFGVVYFILLFIIIVRVARSLSLFRLDTLAETIVFILFVLFLGALPFAAQYLAPYLYSLFSKPYEHHIPEAPDALIHGQKKAVTQIEGEKCYKKVGDEYKQTEKDISNRENCENEHTINGGDYCWGSRESCREAELDYKYGFQYGFQKNLVEFLDYTPVSDETDEKKCDSDNVGDGDVITYRNVIECIEECNKKSDCKGINFNFEEKKCELKTSCDYTVKNVGFIGFKKNKIE